MLSIKLSDTNGIIARALAQARAVKAKPLGVVVIDTGGTSDEDEACCVHAIEQAGFGVDASA